MKLPGDLKVFNILYGTKEWYAFRERGIGGSEAGVLCADNQETYKCQAQLFYEKLGLFNDDFTDNKYTFWGKRHEENIAYAWQFWDWAKKDFIANEAAGNIIRKCQRRNGFVVNTKYPWLFGSIDRMIQQGSLDYMGRPLEDGGILEIKTMSGFVKKKWDTVPGPYLYQVHQYMLIHKKDYAEICLLVDGRDFVLFPIEYNSITGEDLLETTYKFWYNRIVPCKVLVEELQHIKASGGSKDKQDRILAEIARYEPGPENTQAYKDFINQRYEREIERAPTPLGYMDKVRSHCVAQELKKQASAYELLMNNVLRKMHETVKSERIDLTEDGIDFGYTRMYVKANQTNPTMDNRSKVIVSETEIKRIFQQTIDEITDSWAEGRIFLT